MSMNVVSKYSRMIELTSIGKATAGTYPTFEEFRIALDTARVFGDYEKRVVIISPDNLHIEYLFVREQGEQSNPCDEQWNRNRGK